MTTPPELITVAQFAAMRQNDDWTEELIGGVLYRSPPGYAAHGILCGNLAFHLGECRRSGAVVSAGSGLVVARDPDSVLVPDLQVFSADRPPDTTDGWPTNPPALVAEVVNGPADDAHVMRKVPLYLAFGVDVVWVVRPNLRDVSVYPLFAHKRPFDRTHREIGSLVGERRCAHDTLDGGDVLPGFSCKVSDLFA